MNIDDLIAALVAIKDQRTSKDREVHFLCKVGDDAGDYRQFQSVEIDKDGGIVLVERHSTIADFAAMFRR